MRPGYIVAIDGPAGAGKSTVSRQLADALGGYLLDTGSMYRAVAYFALKEGAKTAREYGAIARRLDFEMDLPTQTLLVGGENMGQRIRTTNVSRLASDVSRFKSVRQALTARQRSLGRRLAKRLPVVVEGRDIGTVVFPDVRFKFFVTASPEVRAERRYKQLKKQGHRVTLREVLRQQEARDDQDSSRKIAPLKCPEDAVIVDTSSMSIHQVVRFMSDHIRNTLSIERGNR